MADGNNDQRAAGSAQVMADNTTPSAKPIEEASAPTRIQQPKPQSIPSRSGPSSILVSTRQKGNPILNSVKSVPWEYSDIPADYVLGATTCALFLSLKYHRLHPEYIYNRIQKLRGMYNLRIVLTMVDISNHEEPLKELSKTSLINNVTIILCWSAQEAGRYLELFKTYEHAAPTSIKAHQSTSYMDRLTDFVTVPRSINKTDALGLVSNFGSIRRAVNAPPEELALIAGWGEKKVQRWCNSVREPFRVRSKKRGLSTEQSRASLSRDASRAEGEGTSRIESGLLDGRSGSIPEVIPISNPTHKTLVSESRKHERPATDPYEMGPNPEDAQRDTDGQVTNLDATRRAPPPIVPAKRKTDGEELSEGVMAALDKLRKA